MSNSSQTMLLQQFKQALQQRYPITLKSHGGTATLSLLAIGLTGCGGGGSTATTSTSTLGGSAVKGPLSNALVFVDLDGDERLDDGEVSTTTNADGSYTLSSTDASKLDGQIVVQTTENTVDTSSGEVLSGLTLTAPEGSQIVSPLTTLINNAIGEKLSTETDAQYQARIEAEEADLRDDLGLPTDIDLITFNPFDTDDLAAAKAVEIVAQQVTAIVNTIAKAVEAAGGDGEAAVAEALAQVTTSIEDGDSLTSLATITDILNAVDTTDTDADLSSNSNDISSAISQVASTIATEVNGADSLADAREIFAIAQTTLSDAAATGSSDLLTLLGDSNTDFTALANARIEVGGDTEATVEENEAGESSLTTTGTLTVSDNNENDAITFRVKAGTATDIGSNQGTLTVNNQGEWTYTLNDVSALDALQDPDNRAGLAGDQDSSDFKLTEQFVVTIEQVDATQDAENPTVSDATYRSSSAVITKVITVNITGNNDDPVAADRNGITLSDSSTLTIDKDYLADQISDVDNTDGQLSIQSVVVTSGPGEISGSDGSFTYTPTDVSENTEVVLTYTLSDGNATDTGTITLNVVDTIDLGETVEDTPETLADLKAAAATALGVEASTIEIALADSPDTNLTGNYTPEANFNGTVNFVVKQSGQANLPATLTVTPDNDVAGGAVTISGTPFEANELTAVTSSITDVDGIENATFTYQWKADGTDIEGATSSTFTPEEAQIGQAISVAVSFEDDGGSTETLTSAATDAVGGVENNRATLSTADGAVVASLIDLPDGASTEVTGVTQTFRVGGLEDSNGNEINLTTLFSTNSNNQIIFNDAGNIGFEQSDYTVTVEVTDGNTSFTVDVDLDSDPLNLVMGADIGETGADSLDTLEGILVADIDGATLTEASNGDLTFVETLRGHTIVYRKEQDSDNETSTFDSIRITETDNGTLVAELSGFTITESEATALFQDTAEPADSEDYYFTSAAETLLGNNDFNITVEDGLSGGILSGPDNGSFVKMTGSSGNDTFILQNNTEYNGQFGAIDVVTGSGNDELLFFLDGETYVLGDVAVTDFTAGSDSITLVVDDTETAQVAYEELRDGDNNLLGTEITFAPNEQANSDDYGLIVLEGISQAQAEAAVALDIL